MDDEIHEKLFEYLEQEQLSQDAFAARLNVSQGLVHQWVKKRTKITAERACQIEQVTKGKLTRFDLRPDLFFSSSAAVA